MATRDKHTSRKRKAEDIPPKSEICILRYDQSKCDNFTDLSKGKDPHERLRRLHEYRDLRLSQPSGSLERMESVCSLIPSDIKENQGYHRDCYQHFTRNIGRLKSSCSTGEFASGAKVKQGRKSDDKVALFNKDCIFCNCEGPISVKSSSSWTTEMTTKFKSDAWLTVTECAELKKDEKLLIRIRGVDLFAAEAHFHSSCRRRYIRDYENLQRKASGDSDTLQGRREDAHSVAFDLVCKRVNDEIIDKKMVLKLSDLLDTYIESLDKTEFANQSYRGEKLKKKLENRFNVTIAFIKFDAKGKYLSQLVYNSDIKLETAVKSAFLLGSQDILAETALYLRGTILDSFGNADELRWPPTADYLSNIAEVVPVQLNSFLGQILSGKHKGTSAKTDRIVSSIGQDICRAVTNGEWKLPKHIFVAMTLRHMFRSKQLTTLLNRLGHFESHSFSVELETALAKATDETSSYLTCQIVRNPTVPFLFHSEFDNFDQLVSTMKGSGSVHTAHGIMMEEILADYSDHGGSVPDVQQTPRSKERSLNLPAQDALPDCFVGQRKSPPYQVFRRVYPGTDQSLETATNKDIIWLFLRQLRSPHDQEVSSWTGFVSVTGSVPKQLTIIDYFPVINNPITEYRTVQECLRYAEEASKEVGQSYVVTTFDLGVCMKAYPLVWNSLEKYKNHIVMIGTFHLICAYLKMIGKKMAGSGLSDVMLEAGLIGSGSIHGVLTGKHYERAMYCHKTLLESLERILIEHFLEEEGQIALFSDLPDISVQLVDTVTKCPSKNVLEEVLNDHHIVGCLRNYHEFKSRVREGSLGKTATFWISYMDHVWLVLSLLRAVKTNDFLLYADTLGKMPDIFFSFDGHNYARYLTFFSVFLANIDQSHPGASELLQRGAISVARSFIPGNRCAVGKTMEETFMKHAKSHGGAGGSGSGITGISRNYNAYQRWVRSTHERSKYAEATLNMADMLIDSESSQWHRDLRPSEIQKSDNEVCKTVETLKGYLDPFSVNDKDHLYCISSGARVPDEIEKDILRAEIRGREEKEKFISERLERNEKFWEPIKRSNLKSMENMGKVGKVKSSKNKFIEFRQQGNIAIQLLVLSQRPEINVDLAVLMKYPLTPVPFSIGTSDGYLAKNDKSKGLKHIIEGIEFADNPVQDRKLLVIEDGNALFHSIRELPGTFKQISEKLFNMIPQKCDVIFSTDMYRENSIKALERKRRGCSDKLLLQGENTKKPADWKSFLSNDENKTQLVKLISKCWENDSFAKKLEGRKVIFVCEGECFLFTSQDGLTVQKTSVHILKSNQEETDTRVDHKDPISR